MHPYSVQNYFKQNKRRFVSVALATFLGVLVVYGLTMVISGIGNAYGRSTLEPKKHLSTLYARGTTMTPAVMEQLKKQESIAKVMPVVTYNIPIRLTIGGFNNTELYILSNDNIKATLKNFDLKLVEGRLPLTGSLEVVLHASVAKGLGVHVGDRIGSGLSNSLWLPEEYKVVGIVDGKAMVSFGQLIINDAYRYGLLVFPKEGKLDQMNSYLAGLATRTLSVNTLSSDRDALNKTMGNIDLLITVFCILVIVIVSTCCGFLCYIYFSQRKHEFGLVWALGYTRQEIVNRSFAEIGLMNAVGLALGILAVILAGFLLNVFFLDPLGQPLTLISADLLARALCVAVFSAFFSLLPIWRFLKGLEPIQTIEGVE
ncbi:MAG: ABC transporter permease [Clostridia bacterium]|nr:ABC transporter permease [Clostridia bacterium]